MMKKMMMFLMFFACLSLTACGSDGGDSGSRSISEEATTEAAEEATTIHQHEWTYMENDTQTWQECEACGARKDIQDKVTEATTEATEATTQATEATTQAAATTQKKAESTTKKKSKETKKTKKTKKKKSKTRDDYKTDHNYDWYMRNGEGGEKFSYTMEVVQKVEEGIYLCDLGSSYSGNMVFVYVDTDDFTKELTGGKKIIEDDIIRVYGTFLKTYIYETASGGSKEALIVQAVFVDIQ